MLFHQVSPFLYITVYIQNFNVCFPRPQLTPILWDHLK